MSEKRSKYADCALHPSHELRLFCAHCERPLCEQCAETYEHSSHAVMALTAALHKYTQAIEATAGQLRASVRDGSWSRVDAQAVNSDSVRTEREGALAPLIAHFDAQSRRFANSLCRAITADDARRVLRRQERINAAAIAIARKMNNGGDSHGNQNDITTLLAALDADLLDEEAEEIEAVFGKFQTSFDLGTTQETAREVIVTRRLPFPTRSFIRDPNCIIHSNCSSLPSDFSYKVVGSKGHMKNQFMNPQGICCTAGGEIIVADSQHQAAMAFTVKMFSAEGVFIRQFGGRGREAGRTQRPTGVAVVPSNDNILIADYDCKWISVFDRTGRYIRRFGQGKLLGPKGVAVDAYGRIVVVDNKQSAIFVYSSDYKLIRRFGTRGTRPHQLAGPHYVAFGLEGELFVTDFHHHCVKVYDISGEYLFSFGENGDGDGQFNAPTGIAVDSDGTVLVADWGNNRIQTFDRQGAYRSVVAGTTDNIYGPQGVVVVQPGVVAVADSGNHCYKTFRYV